MSLSNESIISGMKRALAAGHPISSLTSNPNFASLSTEDKRAVLSGLKEELIKSPKSSKGDLLKVLKGTVTGAAAGIPLGALIPVGITMSQEGFTRQGLKGAVGMLRANKTLQGLAGASMGIGALGGLANSALSIWNSRKNDQALLEDLEEVQSDRGLAAALYGGIGRSTSRSVSVAPILEQLNKVSLPYATSTILAGYHDGSSPDVERDAELTAKIKEKLLRSHPIDPDRVDSLVERSTKNMGHRAALHSIVSNQSDLIGLDPSAAHDIANDIAENHGREGENLTELNQLAQAARLIRNQRRGL